MTPSLQEALDLWQRGQPARAREICARLLEEMPGQIDTCKLLAEIHRSTGDLSGAIRYLALVTRGAPRDAAARRRLADALRESGDIAGAIESYRSAIDLEPANPRAYNNLGRTLAIARNFQGALECFRQAIARDPDYAHAHHNLGNVLATLGEIDAALRHQQRATELDPAIADAWRAAAELLHALGRYPEAADACEAALRLRPQDPATLLTLAGALREMHQGEAALACCDDVLRREPSRAEALYVRAMVLQELGRRSESLEAFGQLLALEPEQWNAHVQSVMAQIPIVPSSVQEVLESRAAFAAALRDLDRRLASAPAVNAELVVGAHQPFQLAYQELDNRELLVAYGRWCTSVMSRWYAGRPRQAAAPAAHRSSVTRVGIVSAQICEHSVYRAITRGWLQELDRGRFSVRVFHLGSRVDAETEFARAHAEHFEHGARSLGEWTDCLLSHAIDVLIYPEIGMDALTTQLASLRLAPAQAVAWGHPETSGLPTIDYYLSAEAFEPPTAAQHYSERLIRLPNLGSYLEPADDGEAKAVHPGPPGGDPVFLCPGTPFKYQPQYDAVLVELARRLGRCRFVFFRFEEAALTQRLIERLTAQFARAGLDFSRFVEVQPWLTRAQFVQFMHRAHAMLDTIGFSGFNTAMAAVEHGLPLVTVQGQFMRGRFGAGILERLGLSCLVGADPQQYIDVAVRLVSEPAFNASVREQLVSNRHRLYRDRPVIQGLEDFLEHAARKASP